MDAMRSPWRRYWKAYAGVMFGRQPISREKEGPDVERALRESLDDLLRQMHEQDAAPGCTRAVLRVDLYRDNSL